jgi:hypothetical protein
LLETVKQWEKARNAGAFTETQRERLRDPKTEWHLEADGENKWKLRPLHISNLYTCSPDELQPGQPGGADWYFYNPYNKQPLCFCLRVMDIPGCEDACIENPSFIVAGRFITFSAKVYAGQYLICDGNSKANICDKNWNILQAVEGGSKLPAVSNGGQTISFSCEFGRSERPEVQVRFSTMGGVETVEGR